VILFDLRDLERGGFRFVDADYWQLNCNFSNKSSLKTVQISLQRLKLRAWSVNGLTGQHWALKEP
jgi:hypothetical protein